MTGEHNPWLSARTKKIQTYCEKFEIEIININLIKQLGSILDFQKKGWKRIKEAKISCVKPKDFSRNEGKIKQWENLYC